VSLIQNSLTALEDEGIMVLPNPGELRTQWYGADNGVQHLNSLD